MVLWVEFPYWRMPYCGVPLHMPWYSRKYGQSDTRKLSSNSGNLSIIFQQSSNINGSILFSVVGGLDLALQRTQTFPFSIPSTLAILLTCQRIPLWSFVSFLLLLLFLLPLFRWFRVCLHITVEFLLALSIDLGKVFLLLSLICSLPP